MSTPMSTQTQTTPTEDTKAATPDIAAAGTRATQGGSDTLAQEAAIEDERVRAAAPETGEQLAPLFTPEMAQDFRSRWDAVQIGFVDDPQQAVRQADELVGQVMKSLADTFANERARFESQAQQGDSGSTENLRVALRRYRSFFQRLLSL